MERPFSVYIRAPPNATMIADPVACGSAAIGTSIRLEMSFWTALDEIAAKEGMSSSEFSSPRCTLSLDDPGEVKEFRIAFVAGPV